MMNRWLLPTQAVIGGISYPIHCDYRDILEIFSYFTDPNLPPYIQWQIALGLFYEGDIPQKDYPEAMAYLGAFINGGRTEESGKSPRLLDWEQDAELIAADVNKVAGQDVRALPFLHWWTFLSWFHAIGDGRLSEVVSIRGKLARGKKLEDWEKTFYREHKHLIDMKKQYSRQELQTRQQLERMLE